ncbi:MAG TPA: hypothetical protein ENJ18_00830 [Nannocystis exedens]|nr:hypothetical protein [Nannocystis exedens]
MIDRSRAASLWLFGPALTFAAASAALLTRTITDEAAHPPVSGDRGAVVQSATCARCHPEQHRSWRRTYHRTMTQRATDEALLAPFAGEKLDYLGFRATMDRDSEGRPRVRIVALDEPGEPLLVATVVMTVGSHRYQQYLTRMDRGGTGEVWRLPLAWHVEENRWIHLNGAFLEPAGMPGNAQDYLRHLSRWNDNCVFCHNTEPRPGAEADGSFTTSVGELGIACEACHGPAGEHIERHRDPFRRILLATVAEAGDPSITDPGDLAPDRSSEVCGRCHGNRIARDLAAVLRDGDGFLPGQNLAEVSRPIFADSVLGGSPEKLFEQRFWPDGTPRLSAYEYQGLQLSACYAEGEGLACVDCHSMHGGDPAMQLRPDRQGNATCRSCHDEVAIPSSHGGHTAAVDCAACHMPRLTYGLVQGMISHRISSPDPGALVGRADQPDACTQCHVDRSRTWAAEAMARLGLVGSRAQDPTAQESWASRVVLDLRGGDPLQRVLAADALAQPRTPVSAESRMRWLLGAFEDEYPAVRLAAARGLAKVADEAGDDLLRAKIDEYDFLGDAPGRLAVIDALRTQLGADPFAEHEDRRRWLLDHQERQLLWIGE